MNKLNSVLIVAGTHGNELSGIYLHKLIKEKRYSVDRSTFSAYSIIANSEAVKHNLNQIGLLSEYDAFFTPKKSRFHLIKRVCDKP